MSLASHRTVFMENEAVYCGTMQKQAKALVLTM